MMKNEWELKIFMASGCISATHLMAASQTWDNGAGSFTWDTNALNWNGSAWAPAGARIAPASGLLTWRPTLAQSPSTNPFSVVVNDNGVPSLSATQSFVVTVLRPAAPVVGNFVLSNGLFHLDVNGNSGPDYVLLGTTNLVPPVAWQPLSANAAAILPFNFTVPTTNPSAGFFRIQLAP